MSHGLNKESEKAMKLVDSCLPIDEELSIELFSYFNRVMRRRSAILMRHQVLRVVLEARETKNSAVLRVTFWF